MANIPPASPTAAPATPQSAASAAPKAPLPNGGLPDSIRVNPHHDATEFFNKHKEANAAPPSASPPSAPVGPSAPTEPPKETPVESEKGSLASKLVAKKAPIAAPKETPASQPPEAPIGNPEDKIVLDSKYSAAAHESFAQIKGVCTGLRDQLNAARETERQLKSQLEAAKKTGIPVETAEIEKLRNEHKAMSERLAIVDLQEHPEFQTRFITPQKTALQEAQGLLDANGVSGVKVQDLLSKPRAEFGKVVSEACKGLSPFDQTDFANQMRTAYGLKQQADTALSKSKEVYGHLRNQTVEGQKLVFNKVWERVSGPVGEHLVEVDIPDNATPDQRGAIETYNTAVKGLRTQAEQIAFGAGGPEHVAENAIKAAAYEFHIRHAMPRILGEYEGLLTLNRQMAEQLKSLRDRNPNRQGSATGTVGEGSGIDPAKMDHKQAADHFFSRNSS